MVTLVDWGALLGGLFRMFTLEAQQDGQNIPTYAVKMVLPEIGIFVTFRAYVYYGTVVREVHDK